MDAGYDAMVLAGGAARRLGGADKPGLSVGGTPLLDRVLAACAGAGTTVVVGPERVTRRPVRWVREAPPGGGPVAAVAAGLPQTRAEVVLLLAADLPFFDPATADLLVGALSGPASSTCLSSGPVPSGPGSVVDAALLVDAEGRDQPLAAAYRTAALRTALAGLLAAHGGDPSGLPLRRLVGGLTVRRIADPGRAALDCDTWDDVATARRIADAACGTAIDAAATDTAAGER
ncbi:molybdopterin-guanine dinucleotide biosynthesis protein A [Streptacidiphilus sp. EB129]